MPTSQGTQHVSGGCVCVNERETESDRITGQRLKDRVRRKRRSDCFGPHGARPLAPFVFSGSSSQRLCSSPFFLSLSVPFVAHLLLSPVKINAAHVGLIAVHT